MVDPPIHRLFALGGGARGFTLLEVATVLVILGAGLALYVPTARGQRDRWATLAAREGLVGLVSLARSAALESGGAELRVDTEGDSAWVVSGDSVRRVLRMAPDYGVELGPSSEGPVVLRFGPMGLGRAASRTLEARRGASVATVTVSAYGRVRRW